jgi:hypothetical protein
MIKCIQCKEHKDELKFYKKSDSKTGFASICKSCRKEHRRIRDGYYGRIEEKRSATEYTCIICETTKPLNLENFGPNKNKTNGYTTYCRECIREKSRANSRRVRSKERAEKPEILVTEPLCCQRCGIELLERNSTCPDSGTWADAYLCRACHLETTGRRVYKNKVPKRHSKISQSTLSALIKIEPTVTVKPGRVPA